MDVHQPAFDDTNLKSLDASDCSVIPKEMLKENLYLDISMYTFLKCIIKSVCC